MPRRPTRFAVLGSLLLFAGLVSSTRAADWPQWLGPKRDGSTPEKIAPWKDSPKILWREKVGEGFSSPIIVGGRVFLHTRHPDLAREEEVVTAFEVATGKQLWSAAYPRPRYSSALGTGPRATPAVAGTRLVTLGINGLLSCFEVASGARRWQVDLYQKFQANLPGFAVCGSPLVIGNRVIVSVGGPGHAIVALHAETGDVVWQSLDDPASTSSPVLFAGGARPAGTMPDVVFLTPLRLVGLNPLDGTLQWEHPLVFQPQGTSPTPIIAGNEIVASTQAHGAVAVGIGTQDERLVATPAWQDRGLKSYFSSGVAVRDKVVLVTNTVEVLPAASLTCVAARTGKVLWTKDSVGYFHASVIRTGDDQLLVLNDAGFLTLLDLEGNEPKVLARAEVCGGTLVGPALAGGRLLVRDDRELLCVQLVEEGPPGVSR